MPDLMKVLWIAKAMRECRVDAVILDDSLKPRMHDKTIEALEWMEERDGALVREVSPDVYEVRITPRGLAMLDLATLASGD